MQCVMDFDVEGYDQVIFRALESFLCLFLPLSVVTKLTLKHYYFFLYI